MFPPRGYRDAPCRDSFFADSVYSTSTALWDASIDPYILHFATISIYWYCSDPEPPASTLAFEIFTFDSSTTTFVV
jgi:hypothetical protein